MGLEKACGAVILFLAIGLVQTGETKARRAEFDNDLHSLVKEATRMKNLIVNRVS